MDLGGFSTQNGRENSINDIAEKYYYQCNFAAVTGTTIVSTRFKHNLEQIVSY